MNRPHDLAPLLLPVEPITPDTPVDVAADRFLEPRYERMLSIPVVADGRPVGIVSRFQLNQIFLRRYGRELHGRRPVEHVMNPSPLLLAHDVTLERAAEYVTAHITAPLREDFILAEQGVYRGMGIVLDLLRAMQARVADGAAQLQKAYAQLQASQAQLVQSEKMASLGQMVAGVAHEINTPLGYVRSNVDVLAGVLQQANGALTQADALLTLIVDGGDEAALAQQLAATHAAVTGLRGNGVLDECDALCRDSLYGLDQIRDLVVNLRNFTRLDQARLGDVNLNDCLDQTLTIARHVLKDRITVVKRYGALPPVRCSPSQINQVFLNMITNAAQAIEHADGRLVLTTEHAGDTVRATLEDNGKGISPEHLTRIFDPFFTTKAVGEGTGLGLSICYQIVQAHRGTIAVTSNVGAGTRFVVTLPRDAAAGAGAVPAAA